MYRYSKLIPYPGEQHKSSRGRKDRLRKRSGSFLVLMAILLIAVCLQLQMYESRRQDREVRALSFRMTLMERRTEECMKRLGLTLDYDLGQYT